MQNPQHKQHRHRIIQRLPIPAIELGNGRQREGQRHALEEIVVRAAVEQEWVWVVVRSGRVRGGVPVSDVFLFLDPAVDDAVGEVDEVGGEGKGPGAGYCWGRGGLGEWWGGVRACMRGRGDERSILGTGTPIPRVEDIVNGALRAWVWRFAGVGWL